MLARLLKSKVFQNVLTMGSLSLISQLVGTLSMLILTRIYGPEGIGVQGAFIAAVSVLGPIAALRYPQAIVVALNEHEARAIERTSFFVAFTIFGLLMMVAVLQSNVMAKILGLEDEKWLVFLLPITVMFTAYQEIMAQRLVRMERFGVMGKISVTQSLLINGGRIVTGLIRPHPGNLILMSVLNPLSNAIMSNFNSRRYLTEAVNRPIEKGDVYSTLRKYKDFPFYRLPSDMIYALSEALPVFFLTYFFGPMEAGFYALSRTMLTIPNSIIGNAVGNVTYQRMAHLSREKIPFSPLLRKSALLLFLGPGLIVILLTAIVQPYFEILFGDGWSGAGPVAFWISIWMACNLAHSPATRVANIINRQREVLYFSILFLILQVGILFYFAIYVNNAEYLVAAYSIVGALRALGQSVLLQHFTKVHESMWQS